VKFIFIALHLMHTMYRHLTYTCQFMVCFDLLQRNVDVLFDIQYHIIYVSIVILPMQARSDLKNNVCILTLKHLTLVAKTGIIVTSVEAFCHGILIESWILC